LQASGHTTGQPCERRGPCNLQAGELAFGAQETSSSVQAAAPTDACHARSQTPTRLMLFGSDSERNAVCGIIAEDALTAAAGDSTSKCVAGSSYSFAYNSFQYAATTYQVARNVLQFVTICSHAIHNSRLMFPFPGSSLGSLSFAIPVRTAFARQVRAVK